MNAIPSLCLALAAASLVGATPAFAQTTAEDVRRELQEMRRAYDQQLQKIQRDYEARIQALENRVRASETRSASQTRRAIEARSAPPAAAPAPPTPAQAPPLQAGRAPPPALVTAVGVPTAEAPTPPPAPTTTTGGWVTTPGRAPVQSVTPRSPQVVGPTVGGTSFNLGIGVVLDGRFAAFENDPALYSIPGIQFPAAAGLGPAGFAIGESELLFSANVDSKLFGQLTVALDGQGTASVEEAFFETLSLPWGFALKGGRFLSGFGYLNSVHRHAWDFADAALPYRAFLSNQYRDDGVQLRWLAPTSFLLELGGEIYNGANYPFQGSHTFAGSGGGFIRVGDDINEKLSFRLGVSHLRGRAVARTTDNGLTNFAGVSQITGLDAVLKWAPTGNPSEEHVKLQAEVMHRQDSGGINGIDFYSPAWGWYVQGVWRFLPEWEVAARADSVFIQNYGTAVMDGTTLQGWGTPRSRQSLALSYYTSEFGRFRAQFNRDWSSGLLDHQFLLQYTVSLGAHAAHRY